MRNIKQETTTKRWIFIHKQLVLISPLPVVQTLIRSLILDHLVVLLSLSFSIFVLLSEQSPDEPSLYGNRAAARMMLHDWKKALDDAITATEKDANFTKGYLRAGKCYMQLGDFTRSKMQYEKGMHCVWNHWPSIIKIRFCVSGGCISKFTLLIFANCNYSVRARTK